MNDTTYYDIHRLRATTSCKKKTNKQNLIHCPLIWLEWSFYDLVFAMPSPPLFKVVSNTKPCSKLGGTTLNGWKEEVSIISHRRVTSSGLKKERPVLCRSVLSVFQLVVALIWGMWL